MCNRPGAGPERPELLAHLPDRPRAQDRPIDRGRKASMQRIAERIGKRFQYAWFVVVVIFLVMLASSGLGADCGVLIMPLEQAFGWTRAAIPGRCP